jgi:hypothetical protein
MWGRIHTEYHHDDAGSLVWTCHIIDPLDLLFLIIAVMLITRLDGSSISKDGRKKYFQAGNVLQVLRWFYVKVARHDTAGDRDRDWHDLIFRSALDLPL